MQFYCSAQHNNNNIVKMVKEKTKKKKKNYFLDGADASFTEDVKAWWISQLSMIEIIFLIFYHFFHFTYSTNSSPIQRRGEFFFSVVIRECRSNYNGGVHKFFEALFSASAIVE